MPNEQKWEGKGGKRKGVGQFLNLLIFVGCHVIDEHKRTTPRVLCPLTFVGLPHH
jgi:hypothetical protein